MDGCPPHMIRGDTWMRSMRARSFLGRLATCRRTAWQGPAETEERTRKNGKVRAQASARPAHLDATGCRTEPERGCSVRNNPSDGLRLHCAGRTAGGCSTLEQFRDVRSAPPLSRRTAVKSG